MISILIPTKNEEQDLPGCLASVAWSDDVHVFDSWSVDRTTEIAEKAGAHVTRRGDQGTAAMFGGDEAAHKNWALQNIPFKHIWVFHLDADERVTPELAEAMRAAVLNPGGYVAFRQPRRDFLYGRWLKHVAPSPFNIRLFRRDRMTFTRVINPVPQPGGPVGELTGYLDHFSFSKGLSRWLERHNSYSTMEARQIMLDRQTHRQFSIRKAFFDPDLNQKRFHQKAMFYRLPMRPLVKFVLLYFGKRGFLDGRAGFTYAMLQSFYEYMIVLKTRELELQPD